MSSQSGSPDPRWKYDVYLSFRSKDTLSFISRLYHHLRSAGILVYWGDYAFWPDEEVYRELVEVIQESRVSIIVFSESYAGSKWHLKLLENILECRKTKGQRVVPVFYDVDASEVRNQTGYFGETLRHVESFSEESFSEDQVNVWRKALTEAANISGFHPSNSWNESEDMDRIVESVTFLLPSRDLTVAEYPVGIDSRVGDVIQLLNHEKGEDVLLLGIWGMAGVGKTTIAKAVHNQISRNFEGRKFVPRIWHGLKSYQKPIFSQELLSCIDSTAAATESGKLVLKENFRHKRVFLVLDDVTELYQLEALRGIREWFGSGSRIIITTRDRRLLNELRVDHVYRVKEMDYNESVSLFSRHACEKNIPHINFAGHVKNVVEYCGGLPLALQVLGSFLREKRMEEEWESELEKIKRHPLKGIQNKLKKSFDQLSDDTEKEIFLDIACFLGGMDLSDAIEILNGSGHNAEVGIRDLEEQSLITVDEKKNKLHMHNLLRQMGKEIVRQVSQTKPKEYDVFLSFRGKDTHAAFSSHLHTSLENVGINIFKEDDDAHRRGERMSISQLKAIKGSRLSIVVFSRNYTDSRWCLLELEHIIECYKTKSLVVVPVFYDVDPEDVRNETGMLWEAFQDLLNRISVEEEKVLGWRDALREAGRILGFAVKDSRNKDEDIKKVSECITRWVNRTNLFVADHQVRVQSHIELLIKLLNNQQSEDVLLLGIWGMGGIGKTTIAKALYNQIGCNFEGSSFLPNIRKAWQKYRHASLQERLLSEIYLTREITIPSIEVGKKVLEENLRHKKVLLLLDDVHKLEQLNALCESREWFGPGSIVIITTRNRCLLTMHGVDLVHTMKEMDESESIELFSWHAFKQASPRHDFAQLCTNVVSYSGGLPLALVVLGFELSGKEMTKWESVLDRLKVIPHPNVQDVLRISYDDLNDDKEKDLFLDIAFFFIEMNRKDVTDALKGYGHFVESGITSLVDRSLVTVGENNKFGMHVLVRQMGREIFRERSRMEPGPRIYDVFLSFRGEDTRASFTSHLYTTLQNAGIHAFKDDETLRRGDWLSISLLQAIGQSRISIVVLSRNYANSRWCMIELEKIMECYRTTYQLVVPVFYGVDPSEVRNLRGMFGEAFNDLLKRISVEEDKVLSWKRVLTEIGAISGSVIINSGNESEDIKKVVEDVTYMLDRTKLFVAEHPVGVDSRVEDVIRLLDNHKEKDVLFLGIWGMGGVGKTTIAKAIYNQIGQKFEGRSFLLNVRENWERIDGQISLQNKLLSHIYKETKMKIDNIDEGKIKLKERLFQKRILLVLDDVNKQEQLDALCGSHEWFRTGSRIIITTRNKQLARVGIRKEVSPKKRIRKEEQARVGYDIYTLKQMEERESIELFSWHAFNKASPNEEFQELSGNLVSYSGGLPLALKVLGSYLFERDLIEWNSVLNKLKRIPNDEVQAKLRISFDGLSDDTQKDIFLDIACFFIGMDRMDVIKILNGCEFYADHGISVLVERSLVTVDDNNKLGMHDLLRDMGREIIREKFPKEPESRSRLWHPDEVLGVLRNSRGKETIEGLALKLSRIETIDLRAFEKMNKLRLLQLVGVESVGNFEYVSRDLRWLCWPGFPFSHTPTKCSQGNLVAIELEFSDLNLVWKKAQSLEKLKILNLSHSLYLTKTPNFLYLPSLEKLLLEDCPRLSSVSRTIGRLNELLVINLKGCTSLHKLPRSMYKLKSLKTLILSGCLKIDKLEEDLEQMKSLTTLMADDTAMTQVPNALVRLKSIGYISLCGFEGFAYDVIPAIIWSWTSPTNNVSSRMQTSTDMWSCLVSLIIPTSSFNGLSSIISELPKLRSFRLESSSLLQITGNISLDTINATNCKDLETVATNTTQISNMNISAFVDCCSQADIFGLKYPLNSLLIQMGMNCPVTNTLRESMFQNLDWLTFNSEGSSVIFEVPQVNGRNLKSVILHIVYSSPNIITSGLILKNVSIMTQKTTLVYEGDRLTSLKDDDWQRVVSNLQAGKKVEVVVNFEHGFNVKKTTIYLIYDEPVHQNMEHYHANVIVSSSGNIVSGGNGLVADMNENTLGIVGMPADENATRLSVDDMAADDNVTISTIHYEKQEGLTSFKVSQSAPAFREVRETPTKQIGKWSDDEDTGSIKKRQIPSSSQCGRFFKLRPLIWFGLLVIMVWIIGHHYEKQEGLTLFQVKPIPESQEVCSTTTTKTFKPKSEGLSPLVQTSPITVPSASLFDSRDVSGNSGSKSTTQNQEDRQLEEQTVSSKEASIQLQEHPIEEKNIEPSLVSKDSSVDPKLHSSADGGGKPNIKLPNPQDIMIPSADFFIENFEDSAKDLLGDAANFPTDEFVVDDLLAALDEMFSEDTTVNSPSKTSSSSSSIEAQSIPSISVFLDFINFVEGKDLDTLIGDQESNNILFKKLTMLGEVKSQLPPQFKEVASKAQKYFKNAFEKFPSAQNAISYHQNLVISNTKSQNELENVKVKKINLMKISSQIKNAISDARKKQEQLEAQLKEVAKIESRFLDFQKKSDAALALLMKDLSLKLEEGKKIFEELPVSEKAAKVAKEMKEALAQELKDLQQALKIAKP